MNVSTNARRAVATVLLAAIAVATVAPAAEARKRRHVRYKHTHGGEVCVVRHQPHRVYVRESGIGPVVAFLGGLVIGASVAHASHPDRYYYEDPYCDLRFGSLEVYRTHLHRHHHPRMVRVIDVRSGRCVDTYRYDDGYWYGRDEWRKRHHHHHDRDDWDDDWDDWDD